MSKRTDIAWAAGIIDGEGCLFINKQQPGRCGRINPSYRFYLKVCMGHRPTIDRLQSIFNVGSIHEQRHHHYNTAWIWMVAARQAGEVVNMIRPYLTTKLVEADIALCFLALPRGSVGGRGGNPPMTREMLDAREALFIEMRDVKPSARFRKKSA